MFLYNSIDKKKDLCRYIKDILPMKNVGNTRGVQIIIMIYYLLHLSL